MTRITVRLRQNNCKFLKDSWNQDGHRKILCKKIEKVRKQEEMRVKISLQEYELEYG